MMKENKILGLTVDAIGSRDLDDAIWAEKIGDNYKITIIITNVADLIKIGSQDDKSAYEKGSNFYGENRVTMLDENVTWKYFSLLPKTIRDCIYIQTTINKEGDVIDYDIGKTKFKSLAKLTYDKFENILKTPEVRLHPNMKYCLEVAQILWKKRYLNNNVKPEWENAFNEDGSVKQEIATGLLAQSVIHEFMVHANHMATKEITQNKKNMIYRNQVQKTGDKNGIYEVEPKGHIGLNLQEYGQFTSPMRRYVDLVNQRILLSVIENVPSPYNIISLSPICSYANVISQKVDNISKNKNNNQTEENYGLWIIKRMDTETFSSTLRKIKYVDKNVLDEFNRRLDYGLLTSEDLSYIIFSPDTPFDDEYLSTLLGKIKNTEGLIQKIWKSGVSLNLLPEYECDTYENKEKNIVSIISAGKYIQDCNDDTINKAKDGSLLKIISKALSLKIEKSIKKIIVSEDDSLEKIYNLCRMMEWEEPKFSIKKNENDNKIYYKGSIHVETDTYRFDSPEIKGSSSNSVILSCSEMAFQNLLPYANQINKKNINMYGVNIDELVKTEENIDSKTAFDDFCLKYGAKTETIFTTEHIMPQFFECKTIIESGKNSLSAIGFGDNPQYAENMSKKKLIDILTNRLQNEIENSFHHKIN